MWYGILLFDGSIKITDKLPNKKDYDLILVERKTEKEVFKVIDHLLILFNLPPVGV